MERDMTVRYLFAGLAFAAALAALPALAQAPKPERIAGVIDKVDGHMVMAKSEKGASLKLNLADKVLVVRVEKASLADV
jgi:hypothetical protein